MGYFFFDAVLKFSSWVEIFWVMLVLLGILGRIFFFRGRLKILKYPSGANKIWVRLVL